jgi:hypothetical protein
VELWTRASTWYRRATNPLEPAGVSVSIAVNRVISQHLQRPHRTSVPPVPSRAGRMYDRRYDSRRYYTCTSSTIDRTILLSNGQVQVQVHSRASLPPSQAQKWRAPQYFPSLPVLRRPLLIVSPNRNPELPSARLLHRHLGETISSTSRRATLGERAGPSGVWFSFVSQRPRQNSFISRARLESLALRSLLFLNPHAIPFTTVAILYLPVAFAPIAECLHMNWQSCPRCAHSTAPLLQLRISLSIS